MYREIKRIYQNKLIEVEKSHEFNSECYYYFYNEENAVFGIEKTISNNEYQLLRAQYLEKVFYYSNKDLQEIADYLMNDGVYPFKTESRFLTYVSGEYDEQVNDLLRDYFQEIKIIRYMKFQLVFIFDHFTDDFYGLFETMSDDFGIQFVVHLGFIMDKGLKGSTLREYLNNVVNFKGMNYSNTLDLVFNKEINYHVVQGVVRNQMISKALPHQHLLETFFLNDLNISQTAKVLFMHRNSLINKLEVISRQFGFDVTDFKTACVIWILMK